MNFKSRRWQILLLISLIILSISIFIKFAVGTDTFSQNVRSMFLGSFQKNPFKKTSELKVSLVDKKLNLTFEILEEDKSAFNAFVNNWFGVNEEIKTLSFGIDDNIAQALKPSLPTNLSLKITDKSLSVNSAIIPGLQNALIKSDFELATGSSRLELEYSDPSKYQLKIEDPMDLANYATESGKLTASKKLEGLFKSLPKVATMDLSVNGKNISGSIVLK